jgi:hypothetical protein
VTAQEIKEKVIKTNIETVTVFFESAQVTRKKTLDLEAGKTILKFSDLSPFIDAKSIQVKASGNATVLSVNHQQNFINELEKPKELMELESELKSIEKKIRVEQAYLSIINEEIQFLQENRDIGGRNQEVSVSNLKEASEFYNSTLTKLKLSEIERNSSLISLKENLDKIVRQINTISTKKEFPNGEILVSLNSKTDEKVSIELSYLVGNAGWFPSYDIRATNIEEPLNIIYKANLHQDTKIDWSNVKLTFSSSNPDVSSVAPKLAPYFINYNTVPPSYKMNINQVTGKIYDNEGEPLPGATVIVNGTTIGTTSDINGFYSISVPPNAGTLKYSFIGCTTQELPITSEVMNVNLQQDFLGLDEVVVTGYGGSNSEVTTALQGRVAGVNITNDKSNQIRIRGTNSIPVPIQQERNQTTVEFKVDVPYTIKSDSKNYVIDMTSYQVPSFYEYLCIPKIEKDAFLIANITDWEQYNLLEGEANIFFEETFIGKSLLDVRFVTDTLSISLGRDKNVIVMRDKIKDSTSKQIIGNKKEETKTWRISVRNNKSQAINMVLIDQVPIPTLEEIELAIQNISGGIKNEDTGEIKWIFKLQPNSRKEMELKYSLKYPKFRKLIFE